MKFEVFARSDEPALEVFKVCHDRVFDEDDDEKEHINRISTEARTVYLLWSFDSEIHNGGFDQFFFNSLGDHSSEILSNLKKLEATTSVSLLERAMEWFPDSNPSSDRDKRWEQLEKYEDNEEFENSLDNLDTEFYQYVDNLAKILHEYVRENPEIEIYA